MGKQVCRVEPKEKCIPVPQIDVTVDQLPQDPGATSLQPCCKAAVCQHTQHQVHQNPPEVLCQLPQSEVQLGRDQSLCHYPGTPSCCTSTFLQEGAKAGV